MIFVKTIKLILDIILTLLNIVTAAVILRELKEQKELIESEIKPEQ